MSQKQERQLNKESFDRAGERLLQKIKEQEQISDKEIEESWRRVEVKLISSRFSLKRKLAYAASIAALLAIFFTTGRLLIDFKDKSSASLLPALLDSSVNAQNSKEIVLIAQKEHHVLEGNADISYDRDGDLNVNEKDMTKDADSGDLNVIIVPNGRRANITFSDGTKMFVNSGSRVVYPSVFSKGKREILVEGEVFLEVFKDKKWPFIVKTEKFDVKVLGTSFNISAYKDEAASSVVLVTGSVEVQTVKNEMLKLQPNQLLNYIEDQAKIQNVDVFEYTCWKDNMMLLDDHKAGEILNKLSKSYGVKIVYDQPIADMPVYGKLDLRDDIKDVMNILCLSFSMQYSISSDGSVLLTRSNSSH